METEEKLNGNRKVARIILLNENGEVLLIQRPSDKYGANLWCLVGGKAEYGEELLDTIVRETHEEIGYMLNPANLKYFGEYSDASANPNILWYTHYFYETVSNKTEFVLNPNEAQNIKWFSLEELENCNIAFDHRSVIEQFFK